jgi:hypothetical protein
MDSARGTLASLNPDSGESRTLLARRLLGTCIKETLSRNMDLGSTGGLIPCSETTVPVSLKKPVGAGGRGDGDCRARRMSSQTCPSAEYTARRSCILTLPGDLYVGAGREDVGCHVDSLSPDARRFPAGFMSDQHVFTEPEVVRPHTARGSGSSSRHERDDGLDTDGQAWREESVVCGAVGLTRESWLDLNRTPFSVS